MAKKTGRVTLPSEENFLQETKEMLARLGADALRDSDGTKLDDDIKKLDAKIYSTYFVARGHNDFIEKHLEEIQQIYLMSEPVTATTESLNITFMQSYFSEQIEPDYRHDPKKWWEVMDRTTGDVVPRADWNVDEEGDVVRIEKATAFHDYTVSFLAYMKWDPTQMYNHITNNWGDKPHDIPFDVRGVHSNQFMKEYLQNWMVENPDTDVVRFTTFFYHFTLIFNQLGLEKFVDWFGYGASVSVGALEAFEKEKGYALRPEDLVDEGYYNSTFRVPSKAYLDYIDFVQQFVAGKMSELVDIVHQHGKEAMMFLGDNWIGTEPYGKYFKETGIDAVVGSVGDGTTLRIISDIENVSYTEGRFLPYFFPDTFHEGNDPVIEANENWLTARRALMRKPLDRIGYGGYLSLAYKFPEFVDYVEQVTDEFRDIYDRIHGVKPYSGVKVAILNAWGKLRSWQSHIVAHGKWYQQAYSYHGVLEALSGASVDVCFISFSDVVESGIPDDVDVILNVGDAYTAFSGGENWKNRSLITKLKAWIHDGGGLIGIGEPSAYSANGRFFQLANVLGVDKEQGFGLSTNKYFTETKASHFISQDVTKFDFGEVVKSVFALGEDTEIVEYSDGGVHLSSHSFGNGCGVYIAGLPYSAENTRLLMRSLFHASGKEAEFYIWHAENIYCEVHAYPEVGQYAITNNSNESQTTVVYDGDGKKETYTLNPSEILWEEI